MEESRITCDTLILNLSSQIYVLYDKYTTELLGRTKGNDPLQFKTVLVVAQVACPYDVRTVDRKVAQCM